MGSKLILERLDHIEYLLTKLIRRGDFLMATIQDVAAAVAQESTVEDSVITLLGGISAQLTAAIAANDPVATQAVVDSVNNNISKLTAAVTANTPSAGASGSTGATGA